ncbi:MAG: symmetrical bis(5'-nucleosyl)-tetraphosphatase [Acidobacteriota bacterium]|nr:symmetrical bis(5'-nucleosyl)-tetraphosphatase [Acidobacteriota bacterium]MDH3523831.1 symmetrical bis(5'-nucleosyl)-tetraphosphatase [Acidobacteriota bacterium]
MATFAIGDIHGCYRELRRLLAVLPIDWERDTLWLVGDLVNRGPSSLRVLRWARKTSKAMGERFQAVLGNHDLRLLAMAWGVVAPRAGDTAREVLKAPDRERLLSWLAGRPLVHRQGDRLLVHAGLWPGWTGRAAEKQARLVERALAKGKGKARRLLDPSVDRAALPEALAAMASALEAFTLLRSCTPKGKPCDYTGPPVGAPKGCMPWFEIPGRKSADLTIVCGHWAALGLRIQQGLFALDTGCFWGGALTAVRLEDGAVFSQRAL